MRISPSTCCVLALLLTAFSAPASAQNDDPTDRELLVQWTEKAATSYADPTLAARRWVTNDPPVELLIFTDPTARETAAARLGKSFAVTPNRVVTFRADPDDPDYVIQRANLERTGFPEAWDLTSGGRTVDGHDIVVAVLDAGFEVNHPDLAGNLWANPDELPGDGIDNDGNGLIDDINGWNFDDGSPLHPRDSHGARVTGVLGARGNNGMGVTGTNWDIKMMLFSVRTIDDIVGAYAYIRDQRRLFNQTDGAEGAFVVATNASFGVEGGTCDDFPAWGAFYEELGREGILTAASTANRRWDVDTFGDMPTDCPSEYLIGVTNVGETNALYRSSAFGAASVDLAAPGEGSYTITLGNQYAPFGSTSAAAPYVTGAIALLYASPCSDLSTNARRDPAAVALQVRQALLTTTNISGSLRGRTVTGGVLNVAAAQDRLAAACGVSAADGFAVIAVRPNPVRGWVELTTNAVILSSSRRVDVYDRYGRCVRTAAGRRLAGSPARLNVDLTGLPAGLYLLRITERGRTAVVKVVVG